ncbi:endocuticle structural glycoprotein ABD-4-like isoform X2 [Thrips palmi]|uniref:Endocuticle structural glycoprotein ABD-4-like isoform X2 n=1 Tax=Thrips palmi TaxID=161013 RepID=A0A6P9A0L8_THRPL|nr:endocuticle structural glycoprotein ABD-4-like isoform X2 [Thrips palmi]
MNSLVFLAVAAASVALVSSAPQRALPPRGPPGQQPQGQQIPIISQTSEINPDGSYKWSYETGNQIKANEEGAVKNLGNPEAEAMSAQGGFSYTADDGTPIQVQYIADENGFQPQGAHLPTPPPIPEAILKSIEYNKAHPEEDESQGGGQAAPARKG